MLVRVINSLAVKALLKGSPEDAASIVDIRQKIMKAYPAENVSVEYDSDGLLIITLTNSPYNQLDDVLKWAKARDIARFVKYNYKTINRVNEIQVGFEARTHYLFFDYAPIRAYIFNLPELY